MKRWNNYKHRFIPWIAANWQSKRLVKKIESSITREDVTHAVCSLCTLMQSLATVHPLQMPSAVNRLTYDQLITNNKLSSDIMQDLYGFTLSIDASHLMNGGRGVFIKHGTVKKGQIVALYPGTLYAPGEPILLQSINNSFILRCVNGILVDGKNTGLSRLIYRSSAFRDVIGRFMSCDITWLHLFPINPLSIGQIVNNAPKLESVNVEYIELNLPVLSNELTHFLPNVHFQPLLNDWHSSKSNGHFVVGLLATRDISCGEELYSSYFTLVND